MGAVAEAVVIEAQPVALALVVALLALLQGPAPGMAMVPELAALILAALVLVALVLVALVLVALALVALALVALALVALALAAWSVHCRLSQFDQVFLLT